MDVCAAAPLPPLALAPMAEFTSPPMRLICQEHGAQWTYTEMVNAEGLCRDNPKTRFLLETFPEERHVWAHLYGAEPARLAEAAKRVEALGRFEGIDLNAGCPVPRITAQGAGSALLHDLPRLGRILRALSGAVKLPITLKTRLGPNPNLRTWRETLRVAEENGAAAITLHARYTSQGHAGAVQLDALAQAVAASALPIYGNGSIVDRASAEAMARTGVKALLVARAALDNPAIFALTPPPVRDAAALARRHLALELRYRRHAAAWSRLDPEEAAVLTFRRHLFRYFKGLPGANTLRGKLFQLRSIADIERALEAFQ